MKTLEIKLAGLLFKVWYDGETYAIHSLKLYDPGKEDIWGALPPGMDMTVLSFLTPNVIKEREA